MTPHDLADELRSLLGDERDRIANAANMAALLNERLPRVNWVGFYFLRGNQLVVGPFQGRPACVRIDVGRGVCGTALAEDRTLVVEDVHQFPGHIACDPVSRSELVVPIRATGGCVGVLDIDSPDLNRFTRADANLLEELVGIFEQACDWTT